MSRSSREYQRWPSELLLILIFVLLLLLAGLVGLLWGRWNRLALTPTSTPTATDAPLPTVTPDIQGTMVIGEILTQIATLTPATPTTVTTQPPTTEPISLESTVTSELDSVSSPGTPSGETPNPTNVDTATRSIMLPVISSGEAASATPTITPSSVSTMTAVVMLPILSVDSPPGSITPTQTLTPAIDFTAAEQTATALAASVETPNATTETITPATLVTPTTTPDITATPTFVPTATPIPSPTATLPPLPTPTPTVFTIAQLSANVWANPVQLHVGPSTIYTTTKELARNVGITLLGRDPTGEWVYVQDSEEERGWLRQAHIVMGTNSLPSNAPEDADPNDVRWLRIEPLQANLSPVPQSPKVAIGHYPLLRYDATNQTNVTILPSPPLTLQWPSRPRAQEPILSPAMVTDRGVFFTSQDGHLYSYQRTNGDQRWNHRFDGQTIQVAPAIRGPFIYVASDIGEIMAIEDRGNQSTRHWQRSLVVDGTTLTPSTGLNILADTIYFAASSNNGSTHFLVAIDRIDGELLFSTEISGSKLHYPAIGYQLVYTANESVVALDVNTGVVIWRASDDPDQQFDSIENVSAPPVYSAPGEVALAELYVADNLSAIHALDANTGTRLWRYTSGEVTTGLALDSTTLYASGTNFVKAITRDEGKERWFTNVPGTVQGGPLVAGNRLLVVTDSGVVMILDAITGNSLYTLLVETNVINAPSVSSSYLILPVDGNTLRVYRGAE
ncbi:PQQ-binding-like beta-propeller repeat protein [Chloroflexi bacterium TSY]|nr:PQQ-binding-like beta-propeller repeat protein [Chloroflexi bacterium TSY]